MNRNLSGKNGLGKCSILAVLLALMGCGRESTTSHTDIANAPAPPPSVEPSAPPPVREPGYPFNTELPEHHLHKWQVPPPKPLSAQPLPLVGEELVLEKYVKNLHGSVRKMPKGVINPALNASVPPDGHLVVDLARCGAYQKVRDLPMLDKVSEMDLSRSNINFEDLQDLAAAKNLVVLNLTFANITDNDLKWLEQLPNLRILVLFHTATTRQGVQRLKSKNPQLRVIHQELPSPFPDDLKPPGAH